METHEPAFDTGKSVEPATAAPASAADTSVKPGTILGKPVFIHDVTPFNEHSAFEEKQLCDGYTFTAGTSCAYGCTYCYVESQVYKQNRVRQILDETGRAFEELVIRRANPLQRLALALTHEQIRR
jgi:sulfatase maturation enzyme AslB (radical SAM superfamily)